MERLAGALPATAATADRRAGAGGTLRGRPGKVADGSSTSLPDTPAHQKRYPQPGSQKPGCGFPVMKFAGLFSLCRGAMLAVACGRRKPHGLRLLRALWEALKTGAILLGDRAYGEYATLAALPGRGVEVVARLHQRRKVDFRRAQRLGRDDGLCTWGKSSQRSARFSPREWGRLPAPITVRLGRFNATIRGFRDRRNTLVTTRLDAEGYPAAELAALYARRWRLERCLRDLKTTMGMEELRCKTPAMVAKELLA